MNFHRQLAAGMRQSPPASTDWWLAGGLDPAKAIVAFDPKSAVTYADSKVNLANPGTYDADIVSGKTNDPIFASGTGWTFAFASEQALAAQLGLQSLGGEQILLCRVSGIAKPGDNFITGFFDTNAERNYWCAARSDFVYARYGSTNTASASPGIPSGIVGMRRTDSNTKTECWVNGIIRDTRTSIYYLSGGIGSFTIGCNYSTATDVYAGWLTGTIAALFVGKNMTDSEIVNISNAMAAIT